MLSSLASHAFSATAEPLRQSSTAVCPQLNTTVTCQETNSVFLHCNPCLFSQLRILSSLAKTILTFQVTKKLKHYLITVASRLIEYCHTGNFNFPVLILKYFNLKNYLEKFDENCIIYSKEVLVNEIN